MRKIAFFASLIIAITLLLLLVGCGGGKDSGDGTQGANTETDTGTDTGTDTPTPDEKSETEKKIYALADAYSNKDLAALADLVYSNAKGKELFLGANTAENYFEGYVSLKINSVTELYNDGKDAGYTISAKLKYSDVDNDGNEVEGETDVSGSVYLVKNDGNWYFTEMPNLDFMKKTLSTRENDGAEYYYGEYFYSVSPVRVNDETKKITIAFDNNLPSTVNVSKYFRSYGDASIKFGYESVGGFTESSTAFIPSGSTKAYHMLVVEADGEEITYDIVILKKEPVTVAFYDYKGEEVIKSVQLMQFEKVEAIDFESPLNGKFVGWRDSRGNEFDFTSRVESSMALYESFITDWNKDLIEKIDSYKGKEITEDDKSDIYALYETYSALDSYDASTIYNRYTLEEIYNKAVAFDWKVSMDYSIMKYTIVKYVGSELKTRIPSQVNGVEVVSIQQEAFDGKELDELVIPDSIVRVPVRMFGSGFVKEVFCSGGIEYTDEGWMKDCFKSDDGRVSEVYEYFVEKKTEDGVLYYLVTDEYGLGKAIVKGVQTDATEITIPGQVGRFDVTTIGKDSFKGRDDIKKVVLPELKTIKSGAFDGCTSLDELVIGGEPMVEDGAFANCKVKSVTANISFAPLFSTSDVEIFNVSGSSVAANSFDGYTSLSTIVLDEDVIEIEDGAFENFTSLKKVVINASEITLGENAFNGCTSIEIVQAPFNVIEALAKDALTEIKIIGDANITSTTLESCVLLKKLEIAGGTVVIAESAFSGNATLESLVISGDDVTIGRRSFYQCGALVSLEVSGNVTIGSQSFYQCGALESISVPSGNVIIGEWSFYSCSTLVNATLTGVTEIQNIAFEGCGSLTEIVFSDNIRDIGKDAFSNCNKIIYSVYEEFSYLGNEENPYLVLVGKKGASSSFCRLNEKTRVISYGALSGVSQVVIPENTAMTRIGNGAFTETYFESFTIPASITNIGDCAFYKSYVQNIVIPNGVTEIGNYAFRDCRFLTSIVIPGGVESIGACAFQGCGALTEITIPNGVTSIGSYAFMQSGLTSIVIPESVTELGSGAFCECHSLESASIGNGVTVIMNELFEGCNNLSSITIGNGITAIREGAFSYTNITSITIPNTVNTSSISASAFSDLYSSNAEIRYGGTVSQWKIACSGWSQLKSYGVKVICTDGTISG